jgi:hypothetical protein
MQNNSLVPTDLLTPQSEATGVWDKSSICIGSVIEQGEPMGDKTRIISIGLEQGH